MVSKGENKTKKICGLSSSVICGFFSFFLFTIFICFVKYISQLIVEKLNCGKQLKLTVNTKVYIQDRLENVYENFFIVEDDVLIDGVSYAILRIDIPFLSVAATALAKATVAAAKATVAEATVALALAKATVAEATVAEATVALMKEKTAAAEAALAAALAAPETTVAAATEKIYNDIVDSIDANIEKVALEYNETTDANKFAGEYKKIVGDSTNPSRLIAVPKSFVHRLDSLNACLIGNDPLGLFGGGEDKKGEKAEMFRKWKNGEKSLQDMKWYEFLPFLAESKMSNQINYFIYKLFVPINRIGCYLQQLNFNRIETICKVFTTLDEAIFFPFLFQTDREKKKTRDIAELEKKKFGKSSAEKTTIDKSINDLKNKNVETDNSSIFDAIKQVLETFFNFSIIFLKKVTLTIFSIIVNYMTLMIDIIEIAFKSFLRVSSGVESQVGSTEKIFSSLITGFSTLLTNPAVLAGVGLATSGIAPVIMQGLSMTTGATAAAMNASSEARMHGEQLKAQGFSNMAGFVAKNPSGVLFFTTTFIKQFFYLGVIGPITLFYRMNETLCVYFDLAKDEEEDIDEIGRQASHIMMKHLNESIVSGTDSFASGNKKLMKASWNGMTSSAKKIATSTVKLFSSKKQDPDSDSSSSGVIPVLPKKFSRKTHTSKVMSRKRSSSGIDTSNIIETKRQRRKPARFEGGRKWQ